MMAYQHSPRALTSGFPKPTKELYNSWGEKSSEFANKLPCVEYPEAVWRMNNDDPRQIKSPTPCGVGQFL
jgi:hypothetical protein